MHYEQRGRKVRAWGRKVQCSASDDAAPDNWTSLAGRMQRELLSLTRYGFVDGVTHEVASTVGTALRGCADLIGPIEADGIAGVHM